MAAGVAAGVVAGVAAAEAAGAVVAGVAAAVSAAGVVVVAVAAGVVEAASHIRKGLILATGSALFRLTGHALPENLRQAFTLAWRALRP